MTFPSCHDELNLLLDKINIAMICSYKDFAMKCQNLTMILLVEIPTDSGTVSYYFTQPTVM